MLVILGIVVGGVIGYKFKTPAKTENAGAVALSSKVALNSNPTIYFDGIIPDLKVKFPPMSESEKCKVLNKQGIFEWGVLAEDGSCLLFSSIPKGSVELSKKMIAYATDILASGGVVVTNNPSARMRCTSVYSEGGSLGTGTHIICHHRFLIFDWWTVNS